MTLKTSLGLNLATSGNTRLISNSGDANFISDHPANSFFESCLYHLHPCIVFMLNRSSTDGLPAGPARYCLVGRHSSVDLDLKGVGEGISYSTKELSLGKRIEASDSLSFK